MAWDDGTSVIDTHIHSSLRVGTRVNPRYGGGVNRRRASVVCMVKMGKRSPGMQGGTPPRTLGPSKGRLGVMHPIRDQNFARQVKAPPPTVI